MTHPKETFVIEVEIIKSEMESSEVVVEGEYMSTEKMEELGYSEHFVQNELSHWSLIALWCPVYTQWRTATKYSKVSMFAKQKKEPIDV